MSSAGAPAPRDRSLGDYELLAKLATGGMAEIFLARKNGARAVDVKDVLVIKRILPHLADDDHFVTMFRDEAKLAALLVHDNVCRVQKLGQAAGGVWFIVMEYLHGVALSRMLSRLSKQRQFLDVRAVAGLIEQACAGLHHAHDARGPDGAPLGVVHRDVSPPNILITTDGVVKLLDFGIAKARGASSKTRTGTVKGKNAYMSPEQILGKPLDRRSDVFALGAVMYELLAVKRLFHRDSDFLTFKAITEEPIPDIRDRRPDLPPAMVAVLTRALAREPEGRFATAKEFGEAVRAAAAQLGGAASPQELSLIVKRDFADELAAKEEILAQARKTAEQSGDDVPSLPASPSSSGVLGIAPTQVSPSPFANEEELEAVDGEMIVHDEPGGRGERSDGTPASMVIAPTPATGRTTRPPIPPPLAGGPRRSVPPTQPPPLPAGATPTSRVAPLAPAPGGPPRPMPGTPVPASVAMVDLADPSTDLLGERKRRARIVMGVGALAAVAIVALLVIGVGGSKKSAAARDADDVAAGLALDGAAALDVPIDAPLPTDASREAIIAENRYGYLTIESKAKITVWIDDKRIVNDAFDQYPLRPGPHKVKVAGPRGKTERFEVIIEATKTVTKTFDW